MRVPVGGNGYPFEVPLWPRLNVLESPQLQNAINRSNALLAVQPVTEYENVIHVLRPQIRRFLPGHVEGMGFAFKGYGWPSDASTGHEFTLDDAEFAGIFIRKSGDSYRIFFALSVVSYSPEAEQDDDPWHIYIDPLDTNNQLLENNSPGQISADILGGLSHFAALSKGMTHSRDFFSLPVERRRQHLRDIELRCEEVCMTRINLREYDVTLRSLKHYYELRDGHVYAVQDKSDSIPAQGSYTSIRFLEIIENDMKNTVSQEKSITSFPYGGAPCMEFTVSGTNQVRYYPLLTLASLSIKEYRSQTESIPAEEQPNK